MDREVVWTRSAWDDAEALAAHIAEASPAYAARVVEDLAAASRSLSRFSGRGQIVPELSDPAIRELLVAPYRLIYLVQPDRIVVLAIIHGARRARRSQ